MLEMLPHGGFSRFIYNLSALQSCLQGAYCFTLSRYLLISFINELAVEKPFRGVQFCRSSSGLHTVQGFTPLMFGSTANTGFGH